MCTQRVNLMQFSNSTGLIQLGSIVTIPVKVPPFQTNGYVYGLEFSKSGRLLYYSTLWPLPIPEVSHIFQYFISTGVETLVGSRPNTAGLSLTALQLAPDGKIYIAQDGEEVLGVITSPETPGLGCNVQFAAVPLSVGSFGTHGLPNHVRDLM